MQNCNRHARLESRSCIFMTTKWIFYSFDCCNFWGWLVGHDLLSWICATATKLSMNIRRYLFDHNSWIWLTHSWFGHDHASMIRLWTCRRNARPASSSLAPRFCCSATWYVHAKYNFAPWSVLLAAWRYFTSRSHNVLAAVKRLLPVMRGLEHACWCSCQS